MTIHIRKSTTADTRTCDYSKVTEEQLFDSSKQHINDVRLALNYFSDLLVKAAVDHDTDKIVDIEGFHRDFIHGFQEPEYTKWWDRHRKLNRHHLTHEDGIPDNVNLIDVLDFIADCVMAGMGRSGSVYPLVLPDALLQKAFQNTVQRLKEQVVVDERA